MTANERKQAAALKAGRDTYQHEVIDYWPACTACGTPIRRNVDTGRRGHWRACGCPDVLWQSTMNGWEKRSRVLQEVLDEVVERWGPALDELGRH